MIILFNSNSSLRTAEEWRQIAVKHKTLADRFLVVAEMAIYYLCVPRMHVLCFNNRQLRTNSFWQTSH